MLPLLRLSLVASPRLMLRSGRVVPLSPEQMMFSLGPVLATAENMAWVDGEEALAA